MITNLSEFHFRRRGFILSLHTKEVIVQGMKEVWTDIYDDGYIYKF